MTKKCKKCNDELKQALAEVGHLKDLLFVEKKGREKAEETLAAAKTDNQNLTKEKYDITNRLKKANEKIYKKLGYDEAI